MSYALIQTAARWKIPRDLASIVIARDLNCVYCRQPFGIAPSPRKTWASWEHIVNDVAIVNEANIVLCCISCNSSKGTKSLGEWLDSKYCKKHEITMHTLAPTVIWGLTATLATLGASSK